MDETTDLNNSNHEASANEMKTKEILYTGASRFRRIINHPCRTSLSLLL
jgi:hypothetical protein